MLVTTRMASAREARREHRVLRDVAHADAAAERAGAAVGRLEADERHRGAGNHAASLIDDGDLTGNPFTSVITPNLFPGASISADLGNGPGIQEVATFSVDVAGPHGKVAVSNAHGTVTGAAGGVLLRPFARLISKDGDSVTTYGEPWNMN